MFGWNESAWQMFFLGAALKSTAVLGAAWLITTLLRGHSAAVRHLVWTAAASGVLALPFLSASLPALQVPARALLPANVRMVFQVTGAAAVDPAAAQAPLAGGPARPVKAAARTASLGLGVMLLWTAGAAIGLAQMLAACFAMRNVRRWARPSPHGGLCRALADALGIRERVRTLETPAGGMPMTFGLLQPTLYLPADAAQWSEERLRVVLLHELAHVRRGDAATHLVARAALSLYWWNPLAWIAWRGFLKERERAADDLVLAAGGRASDYAAQLLEVARSLAPARAVAWAAVTMARRSQLEGRLLAILDSGINRKTPGRAALWLTAVLAAAAIVPLAAVRAQDLPQGELRTPIHAAAALLNADSAIPGAGVEARTEPAPATDVETQSGATQATEKQAEPAPESSTSLLRSGIGAFQAKDYVKATDFFQRVLDLAPTGSEAGRALTLMALVRQQAPGGAAEAESLFERALAAEDPQSQEAAITLDFYALLLREQRRTAEAAAKQGRATEIHQARVGELSHKAAVHGETSQPAHVGGGVSAPTLIFKVEPVYSLEARAAKHQGTVVLRVVVGANGFASDVKLVSGLGFGLDEAAVEAVSQWRFQPGMSEGAPVPVQATIEVNFRLL